MKELISFFIQNQRSENTKRSYKNDLDIFFEYLSDNKLTVKTANVNNLIQFRDQLLLSKSSSSVNRVFSTLKSFYKWLLQSEYIKTNPIEAVKLPKVIVQNPTQAFTDEEVKSILNICKTDRHLLILKLLLTFGLRRSEIVGLDLSSIYEYRGSFILKIIGKGSKVREIPIPKDIMILIERVKESENSLTISSDGIYKLLKSYTDKLNIKGKSPHSCRATVISHLLDSEVPIRDVADFVGHSNLNTTLIYDKKRKGILNSPIFKVNYDN